MRVYKQKNLNEYLNDDWILNMLEKNMTEEESSIRTNQWLMDMDNKRMIYADVYGDILQGKVGTECKVLDVGGGYNAITKVLSQNSTYTCLDFMAHGGNSYLAEISEQYKINWISGDWYEAEWGEYDVIIANDLFPDVDQRLELFLEKALPKCKECRLVVTYYNNPKFYVTKRIDDAEIMMFLSWDGEITGLKLGKYLDRMIEVSKAELDSLKDDFDSIYRNGRQVAYIKLKGDLG